MSKKYLVRNCGFSMCLAAAMLSACANRDEIRVESFTIESVTSTEESTTEDLQVNEEYEVKEFIFESTDGKRRYVDLDNGIDFELDIKEFSPESIIIDVINNVDCDLLFSDHRTLYRWNDGEWVSVDTQTGGAYLDIERIASESKPYTIEESLWTYGELPKGTYKYSLHDFYTRYFTYEFYGYYNDGLPNYDYKMHMNGRVNVGIVFQVN